MAEARLLFLTSVAGYAPSLFNFDWDEMAGIGIGEERGDGEYFTLLYKVRY